MTKLLLWTILLSGIIWQDDDYSKIFGADHQQAMEYCQTEKETINAVTQKYKVPTNAVMSIVFPELIRYSTFKNFFESTALEYAYTKGGSKVADFSIGRFQMKPSFAEKLELALQTDNTLKVKYSTLIEYSTKNLQSQREKRVARLGSLNWQLIYLCGFYDLMQTKTKNISSAEGKIKYIATAYNCGFDKEEATILKWMKRKTFPYGAKYPESHQYNYAEVALDFYTNHALDLF
ncbi:MAG: hypothetical protein GY810_28805 [Aureispira sp.]|nr:hypothetical protein [Aureispira sp.]